MMEQSYLSKYGYLASGSEDGGEEGEEGEKGKEGEEGVRRFQAFTRLEESGQLDKATVEQMRRPRCAMRDLKLSPGASEGGTPAALTRYKWRKMPLTWRVTKPMAGSMPPGLVDLSLRRAFHVWEKHANITFQWVETGVPDLEIRWESGEHGDGDAFDGSGGTLAHAFFPQGDKLSGDIHFDDGEVWTLGTDGTGTNLTQAAAHEMGHALGLDHSPDPDALMAPIYRGYVPGFDLMADDIEKIQMVYGAASAVPESVPEETRWVPGTGAGGGGDSAPGPGAALPFLDHCPCTVL